MFRFKKKPSRYLPETKNDCSLFHSILKKPLVADAKEILDNNNSRSAKLRFGIRNKNSFLYPNEFKNKFINYFELENGRL